MQIYETRKLIFVHNEFGGQGPRTIRVYTSEDSSQNKLIFCVSQHCSGSELCQLHDIFLLHRIGEIRCGKNFVDPLSHPHDNAEMSPQNIY